MHSRPLMSKGWYCFPRELDEDPFFRSLSYSEREMFRDLVRLAVFKETQIFIENVSFVLQPGQVRLTLAELQNLWCDQFKTRAGVLKFLRRLSQGGLILETTLETTQETPNKKQKGHKFKCLTISHKETYEVNFSGSWMKEKCDEETPKETPKETPRKHQIGKNGSTIPIKPLNTSSLKKKKQETSESAEADPVRRQAAELSSSLFQSIKKIKPDALLKTDMWETHLERMLRIDKRDFDIAKKIITWLPTSSFWSKNILSAEKFRTQFDKLELAMKEPLERPKSDIARKLEWKNINIQLVNQAKRECPQEMAYFNNQGDFLVHKPSSKELDLKMLPDAFKAAFLQIAGLIWED